MDKELFRGIYERYAPTVVKTVKARTNDLDLANEIAQNLFAKLFLKIDTLDEERIGGLIMTAMENSLIDYYRRRGKDIKNDSLEDVMETDTFVPEKKYDSDMEERIITRQFTAEIMQDLRSYKETWCEALEMVYILGIPEKEVAEHFGITTDALRAQISRAKKYIQKRYDYP